MAPTYLLELPSSHEELQALWQRIHAWHEDARAHPQLTELRLGPRIDIAKDPHRGTQPKALKMTPYKPLRQGHIACAGQCAHFPWPTKRTSFGLRLREGARIEGMAVRSASPRPVYLGKASVGDRQFVDVAVKIFQASTVVDHLMSPDGAREHFGKEVAWVKERWEAILFRYKREIFAYEKLSSVQGSLVPYLYGFFEVMLPHQEPAIAMLRDAVDAAASLEPAMAAMRGKLARVLPASPHTLRVPPRNELPPVPHLYDHHDHHLQTLLLPRSEKRSMTLHALSLPPAAQKPCVKALAGAAASAAASAVAAIPVPASIAGGRCAHRTSHDGSSSSDESRNRDERKHGDERGACGSKMILAIFGIQLSVCLVALAVQQRHNRVPYDGRCNVPARAPAPHTSRRSSLHTTGQRACGRTSGLASLCATLPYRLLTSLSILCLL
ncbi:hypothetical protein AURDEDRAFT_173357 [Auricularia subglabra TFB-10046 SS5]|nr:hypothetical protein AURDEDRAFT_173357 [Auricularia subglabra TFB-10046 SS5]